MQQYGAFTSHRDCIPDPIAQAWARLSMAEVRKLLERPNPYALQHQYQQFAPQMLGMGVEVQVPSPEIVEPAFILIDQDPPLGFPDINRAA